MLRLTLFALLALAGCHHEPKPMTPKDGELPPLPPASGTPVGYLLDNASQLELRPDQIEKLQAIDASLAARNDGIDTQLREIEQPEAEEPPEKGAQPRPYNNAPGAAPMRTTADAAKLHEAHAANDRDALEQAFALLDPKQQAAARKLLDARGITSPRAANQPPPAPDDGSGVPLEP